MPAKPTSGNSLDAMRHSCAHILAAAVLEMFPEAQLGVGPTIENGFYYDFLLPRTLIPEDLPLLEARMKKFVAQNLTYEGKTVPIAEAKALLQKANQSFKVELVEEIERGERETKEMGTVTFYRVGAFVDLCKGGHVVSTNEVGPFKLLSIAGAYWKGDSARPMLQRIYGTCWPQQKELDDYLAVRQKAEQNDHRKLGETLDLFSFHEEGPGFVFWHPNGVKLIEILTTWWRSAHERAGYQEVKTPYLLDGELWKRSGHWEHYKENMYFVKVDSSKAEIDQRNFALKPMNCPGMILIYKSRSHSYRDLPLRLSELGVVHRHELSGVLHGLFRARSFTIDDAHIFCTKEQIKPEIESVIKLLMQTYKTFDLALAKIELSTRPKKSVGTDAMWSAAEKALQTALGKSTIEYTTNQGEGAFYGPKIDFHIKDSLGRTWQLGTIQLDFSMPERFSLEYVGEDGAKRQPVMIHRAAFGSLERFIGILLEHTGGRLPLWLAPEQVRILPISDEQINYAKTVQGALVKENVRTEIDERAESIGRKIRDAELKKIPLILVVGKKETKQKTVSIREGGKETSKSLNAFIKNAVIRAAAPAM